MLTLQRRERLVAEDVLAIVFGGEIDAVEAASPQARPVPRAQDPQDQPTLHVTLQEPLFEELPPEIEEITSTSSRSCRSWPSTTIVVSRSFSMTP